MADRKVAGDPRYLALLDELRELHLKKCADYGVAEDPLANLRASERFDIPAWIGAMVRAQDKMQRVQAFVRNGNLKNEGVEDSLLDGAAYHLLALILYREANHPRDCKPVVNVKWEQIP